MASVNNNYINRQDGDGATQLHIAALHLSSELGDGYSEIVRLLIEGGADLNTQGNGGMTALMGATNYGVTKSKTVVRGRS